MMRVLRRREPRAVTFELIDDQDQPIPEVAGFLGHLAARGCSPNTLSAYVHDLLHFFRFLELNGQTVDSFGPMQSLALLEYLRRLPSRRSAQRLDLVLTTTDHGQPATCLAAATINRLLAAVSSFYEYLILAGRWAFENPIQRRPDPALMRVGERHRPFMGPASQQRPIRRALRVKTIQRVPRPLSREQVDALLGATHTWRDRAMLLLMLQGGLRPGEVLNLHLDDVQYGRRRVIVRYRTDHPKGARTKSRMERVVDLHEPEALAALSRYVMDERPRDAQTSIVFLVAGRGKTVMAEGASDARDQALAPVRKGPPIPGSAPLPMPVLPGLGKRRTEALSYAALIKLFQRSCDRLGIRAAWVTPHALRHTHATRLWEGGMRELALQKRLGHASAESTRLYTRVSDPVVVAEYRRALGTEPEL